MKPLPYILVSLGILDIHTGAEPCLAQSLSDLIVRQLPATANRDSAAVWLKRGLYYEK